MDRKFAVGDFVVYASDKGAIPLAPTHPATVYTIVSLPTSWNSREYWARDTTKGPDHKLYAFHEADLEFARSSVDEPAPGVASMTRLLGSSPPFPPPRPRWEYLVGSVFDPGSLAEEESHFDMLGQKGWELVAVIGMRPIFKRQVA